MKQYLILAIALTSLWASSSIAQSNRNTTYETAFQNWHQERIDNLKKEDGWLDLVGLYWLQPGENSFGNASDNAIKFPDNFPLPYAGTIELNNGTVILHDKTGRIITNGDSIIYQDQKETQPVILKLNGFRWQIIKRQDRYGIRLRDINLPKRIQFKEIPTFPISKNWKVKAFFEPNNNESDFFSFKNKIGQTFQTKAIGKIVFSWKGKKYRLEVLEESPKGYFIVFADKTSGKTTYPSGRFITVPKADANGETSIDFNRAINPPCAFSNFATCPLPTESNILPIAVEAGEKAIHL